MSRPSTLSNCKDCFSGSTLPRTHQFKDSESALQMFGMLRQSGKTVYLCQRTQQQYRVCHIAQQSPTACEHPRPTATNL